MESLQIILCYNWSAVEKTCVKLVADQPKDASTISADRK